MSQKKIRLIIGLMTLALIGLISFQSYWLGFMLETKKEQLAADIRDGMEKVVRKLEKQELYVLSQKQREYENQQKEIAALEKKLATKDLPTPPKTPQLKDVPTPPHDPLELLTEDIAHEFKFNQSELQALKKFQQNEMPNDILYVRKSFMLPNGQIAEVTEEYQINADLKGINRRLREEKQLNEMMGVVRPRVLQELNRLKESNRLKAREAKRLSELNRIRPKLLAQLHKEDQQKTQKINDLTINAEKLKEEKAELKKVLKKTEMAKEVFADFLFKERPITQRVSTKHIDSLIKQELAAKGISMPYVFGIGPKESQENKNWVYTSAGLMKTPRARAASFSTALFPNDLRPSGQYLQIYFPSQEAMVWKAMSLSFLGSALLLLTMLGCFYIAVTTILKQKKLAEVKNDFINNMTHEFKTPISTISLAAQLIQEESNGINNESINRYVGIIKEENIRLGRQVERVLQTAQMEKENIVLKKKEVNMHTLIQQVVEMNGPLIQSQGGNLHVLLDAAQCIIEVDEVHISNVLFNLLDNAIKYSKEKPEITISTNSTGNSFSVHISDQGIGMAKEVLASVFEPFYRVPTGNVHNVKGFGLGLSYVKKIVEAHGGTVNVSSLLQIGSTFEINLPFNPTE